MADARFGVRENADLCLRGLALRGPAIAMQLAALAPWLPPEAGRRAAAIAEELIGR
jgi:hypothetical protein